MERMEIPGSMSYIRSVNDFIYVSHEPCPCDVIFIPGCAFPEHVLKAAEMYHAGYAPLVLPSGRYAIGTPGFAGDPAYATEWAWMRSLLLSSGVPDACILREDRATYTWENALFSRQVTDGLGLTVRRGMLCCRPFHARRALLYYQAAYPDTEFVVCPASVPGMDRDSWYRTAEGRATVLGEVRRLGDQVNEVFEQMIQNEQARR